MVIPLKTILADRKKTGKPISGFFSYSHSLIPNLIWKPYIKPFVINLFYPWPPMRPQDQPSLGPLMMWGTLAHLTIAFPF